MLPTSDYIFELIQWWTNTQIYRFQATETNKKNYLHFRGLDDGQTMEALDSRHASDYLSTRGECYNSGRNG